MPFNNISCLVIWYIVGLEQDCSNSIFGHFDIFTKIDRKISNTSVQKNII